ncbi:MAG: hypothetical protein K2O91_02015 [Lachnospiraceae bacterium]|nr:hypothetical protein [Lachnospiraceae bacterium]
MPELVLPRGGTSKWKYKNYIYQNRLSCAGGFITDEQIKEVCVSAINQIIQDRRRMKPPISPRPEGTVSTEYGKIERGLEREKARWKQYGSEHDTADREQTSTDTGRPERGTGQTDIMTLLY